MKTTATALGVALLVLLTTLGAFEFSVSAGYRAPVDRFFLTATACVAGILMISDDRELTGGIVQTVYSLTGRRLELCKGEDCLELRFARGKAAGPPPNG